MGECSNALCNFDRAMVAAFSSNTLLVSTTFWLGVYLTVVIAMWAAATLFWLVYEVRGKPQTVAARSAYPEKGGQPKFELSASGGRL